MGVDGARPFQSSAGAGRVAIVQGAGQVTERFLELVEHRSRSRTQGSAGIGWRQG